VVADDLIECLIQYTSRFVASQIAPGRVLADPTAVVAEMLGRTSISQVAAL
jgi:hypothetical protein